MFKSIIDYMFSPSEQVTLYIDWIGRSNHHVIIKSASPKFKYLKENGDFKSGYFLKSPHGRSYDKNEFVFDYIFDDIFRIVKECCTYNCKIEHGKIVEITQIHKNAK